MGQTPEQSRRAFALLWVSQFWSNMGSSITALAYPLLILQLTGSALLAGVLASVSAISSLMFRLPGGVIADRYRSKAVMLSTDMARMALLAVLSVAVATSAVSVPLIIAIVAAEVAFGAMFGPAEFNLLRSVVAVDQRSSAVGKMESRSHLAGLIGPLAGGALFGLSPVAPFAANALSYLISFALVALIRSHARQPRRKREPLRVEVSAGWSWIRKDQFLLTAMFWVAVLTATFGAVGLALLIVTRAGGATPAEIGAMYAISTVGGLLGALFTPWLQGHLRPITILRLAATTDLIATTTVIPISSPYLIGIAGAAAFAFVPAVNAVLYGELSRRCPDAYVGRAQATVSTATAVAGPIAPVAIGLIIDTTAPTIGIAACSLTFLLLTLAAFLLPGFRGRKPEPH